MNCDSGSSCAAMEMNVASLALGPQRALLDEMSADPRGSWAGEALAAVQRLAGAASIHLLRRDAHDEAIEILTGTRSDDGPALGALLRSAVEVAASFTIAPSTPHWIDHPFGTKGQGLLVKVADRPSGMLFLLLTLTDVSDVARVRVGRLVSDLAMLIRHHLSLCQQLSDAEESRDAAREALDHGECGVIAVRADHSIVFSNAAGAHHLAGGSGLRLRRGVLRPVNHGKAIRFEAALDSVIDPAGDRVGRPRASIMLLDDPETAGCSTIIVIAPAGPLALVRDQARGAAAMVYLLRSEQGVARGLDTLCRLHGLSRVESQLIAHLVDGLTISEAATRMRVKVETARTYLKQVFAKTGMHRQTDLIALMTRYLRAVRGDFDFQPA